MILTREAIDDSIYCEHGSLYYTNVEKYSAKPPEEMLPERMISVGYRFTGKALYVYNEFDKICQTWIEIRRGRMNRYILLA